MIFPSPAQVLLSVASVAGVALSALILTSTRFGAASVFLVGFLAPISLACGALGVVGMTPLWTLGEAFLLAYSLTLLAAPAGLLFSLVVAREDPRAILRAQGLYVPVACAVAPLLMVLLHILPPVRGGDFEIPGYLPMGTAGHASGFYLLFISILVLANLERTLRSAEEHVRWEIKFLFIGASAIFASVIYATSKLLLSPIRQPLLSMQAFLVLPLIFPLACLLIFLSWRRSTGRSRVVVSQGILMSSVTFLGVAVYLIASSFAAQWIGTITGAAIGTRAIAFLLSLVVLATAILSTSFRHQAIRWIRRHVYSGRYDYRSLWMEATDRFGESDTPEAVASALADTIHGAIGAIGVTVWIRTRDPGKLRLLATHGIAPDSVPREISGPPGAWISAMDSFEAAEQPSGSDPAWLGRALVVPLRSGGESVGFVTVGHDRSGRAFGWEAHECLRVLASHAAAEFHKRELLTSRVEASEAEAFRAFSTFLLHDLKNFASTLSLVAANAARHKDNPEFQADAFRSVFETAEKMKMLCNRLRTFSGSFAARRTMADLNRLAREVSASLDASSAERVRLKLGAIPPLSIDVDEIASVLRNLLLNAAEAVPASGNVTVSTAHSNGKVELIVEDDGPGISREFLEKELFVPFRTTKSTGLGIGLFQSKKIIEAHGGSIAVESEEGRGTTVRTAFPVPAAHGEVAHPQNGSGRDATITDPR